MLKGLRGKTFVLGVGAQKAGTTWLHNYLNSHHDVYMSPIKELHYFDILYRPDLCAALGGRFRRNLSIKLRNLKVGEPIAERPDIIDLVDRIRMDYQNDAYLDFFCSRAPESAKVVGEITPSYSLIGEAGFREIRELFRNSGISLKVVYLMRDPVERFYSALRMVEHFDQPLSADRSFFEYLSQPEFYERGLYHITMRNLRASFPSSDIFIGFYESLFDHAEIERLCTFLDIDYSVKANFASKLNESPNGTLTDDMRSAGRQRFSEVYEFCRKEFGEALPAAWNSR